MRQRSVSLLRAAVLGMAGILYRIFASFPLRPRRIVFVSYPDAADNSLSMFQYLRDNTAGYEFVWLVDHPSPQVIARLAGARLLARRSARGVFAVASAGLVFHTHGVIRFARSRRGQVIVNLWHGMPLKTIGVFDEGNPAVPIGDYAIATSPLFRDVLARAFVMPPKRVLITGQPRNDALFAAAAAAEPTLALWMPTYRCSNEGMIRQDSPLSPAAFQQLLGRLDDALIARGASITLKLHPMDVLNRLLTPQYRAIELIEGHDQRRSVEQLMAASRCLVTDYSSAAIDYMVLDRPIGYFCPDRADYVRGFIPDVVEPFYAAGDMLEDEAALVEFFINPPPPSETGRRALVSNHDGGSAARLWQALKDEGAAA